MKDEQFGTLTWDDDVWEGKATFARFAGWGGALDEKDPPDTRPATPPDRSPTRRQLEARDQLAAIAKELGGAEGEMLGSLLANFGANMQAKAAPAAEAVEEDEEEDEDAKLLRQGVCGLIIDMNGRRAKPIKGQRAAWDALVARSDALWDELLEQSLAIYQRQLPVRRKWWKVVYGDYLLDRRLPEVTNVEQFTRLIRPGMFRIKPPADKKAASTDISIHVLATWEVDGFGVIIRDGQIAEFGQVVDVVHPATGPRETIHHPVFGPLRRIPSEDVMEYINEWETPKEPGVSGFENARRVATRPWQGLARFDPLLDYAMVADARAAYAHDRERADRPESGMAWEFADGAFELRVYAPAGQPPSTAQADAWSAFRAGEARYARDLIDAVFRQYQETCEVRRRNWTDRYVDDNVPVLNAPEGLRELIQLRHIHVHPADEAGRVTIAFQFVAAYDYDGFSALWRDGKFEEWGTWKDAEFRGLR